MEKIKTVFKIDRNTNSAINEIVSENEWVLNGEGTPTIKLDGTSCMFRDGELFKRFDRKIKKEFKSLIGKQHLSEEMFKDAPNGFVACNAEPDQNTGHWPGWVPITEHDKWHHVGFKNTPDMTNGTFELVGPKVNGNKEQMNDHVLIRHGSIEVTDLKSRTFDDIREWLISHKVEGIVFHHTDGRMAKIRRKDFKLDW